MPEKKSYPVLAGIVCIFQIVSFYVIGIWVFPLLSSDIILPVFFLFAGAEAAICIVIARLHREVLACSIFFVLWGLIMFLPKSWMIFVVYLYYSLVPYLILILTVPYFKSAREWLKWGRIDRVTLILLIATVAVTSGALTLWTYLVKPDMRGFLSVIPFDNTPLFILMMLGFSLFNAIGEEAIFRGILQHGLSRAFPPVAVILIQGVMFGAIHFHGYPSGISGVALASVYGIGLGWIRQRSGGMLAPLLAHFFADLTIFLIVALTHGNLG